MIQFDSDSDGVILSGDDLERAFDLIIKLEDCRNQYPSLWTEIEGLRCGMTRALAKQTSILDDRFLEALDAFFEIKNSQEMVGMRCFKFLDEIFTVSLYLV